MEAEQVDHAIKSIGSVESIDALEAIRVEWLGKKGKITAALRSLSELPLAEKKERGLLLNGFKQRLVASLDVQRQQLEQAVVGKRMSQQKIDVTRPARYNAVGAQHPVHHVIEHLISWFSERGFEFVDGPEVETEYYNFTALNFPEDHPSREMHDTFYVEGDKLLRTHTSSVQIRCMHNRKPPFSFLTAGKTFRVDSDRTHLPMFHQIEGMVVSKTTSYSELKGLLTAFLKHLFGSKIAIRFRPSYFPFTEPSAEVDIQGDNGKWLEVLGCGMIHPNVLSEAEVDPNQYQGFAFGVGVDRLAMLLHGVSDIRNFVIGDVNFLEQFK